LSEARKKYDPPSDFGIYEMRVEWRLGKGNLKRPGGVGKGVHGWGVMDG
jgi:hypothetical protein